jgi:hypothetical protein
MEPNTAAMIHGEKWNLADLAPKIEQCRRGNWNRQPWKPRDALVQRAGGMVMPYYGQAYNPEDFEVVRLGWKRNLCEICYWELCESADPQRSIGYTDGRQWLCIECYDLFMSGGKKPL